MCNCRNCKLMRRLAPLLAKATSKELDALEELFLRWEAASTDAVYWRMKFKGTWPSAR